MFDREIKYVGDEPWSRLQELTSVGKSPETILKEKYETALNIKFTQNLALFETDTVFDLVILQAKQFIYKCKLDKYLPTLSCFIQQLILRYKIEEYNSKTSGELHVHL